MMATSKIAILYGPGTNCHEETKFAIEYSGGEAEIISVQALLNGERRLCDYAGMVIPGGAAWGIHIAPGRIFAIHIIAKLKEDIESFIERGKPILGISNGNQVLMEAGILPFTKIGEGTAAIIQNKSARFESRWSRLIVGEESPFSKGLSGKILRLPIAYGDGRVYSNNKPLRAAFYYVDEKGNPSEVYPHNPATSPRGIAGVVNSTGRILGMMPHPERAILPNHGSTDGKVIFENLVELCKS